MRFKFNFFFFGLLLRSSSSLLIYFATLLSLRLWCLVFDLLFLCAPNVTMLMNFPIWRKFSQLILLKKKKDWILLALKPQWYKCFLYD